MIAASKPKVVKALNNDIAVIAKATRPNSLGSNNLARTIAETILDALSNQRKAVK